jgi:RTX calcium-binding nonapeptide repeat (4 copies)
MVGSYKSAMARRRKLFFLRGGVVALALALPGVANAATVSITTAFQRADLTYTAAPGEQNRVAINPIEPAGFGGWLVRETGPGVTLTPGAGCSSVDPETVKCPTAQTEAVLYVSVTLNDLRDIASLASACGYVADELDFPCGSVNGDAGAGDDEIVANDAVVFPNDTTVTRGAGSDLLIAGEMGGVLKGGPGNDNLSGAGGHDLLIAGDGSDFVFAGAGNDVIRGGPGNDKIYAGWGADRVEARAGNDTICARDRRRDVLKGGYGSDRARVDRIDVTTSIERFVSGDDAERVCP